MIIVATTSLPAVDCPSANHWNAARSCQFLGDILVTFFRYLGDILAIFCNIWVISRRYFGDIKAKFGRYQSRVYLFDNWLIYK